MKYKCRKNVGFFLHFFNQCMKKTLWRKMSVNLKQILHWLQSSVCLTIHVSIYLFQLVYVAFSLDLSIYLSISFSSYLCPFMSINLCLSILLYIYLSFYLSLLSICLSTLVCSCLFQSGSIYLSIYLCPFISINICLSIFL